MSYFLIFAPFLPLGALLGANVATIAGYVLLSHKQIEVLQLPVLLALLLLLLLLLQPLLLPLLLQQLLDMSSCLINI